MYLMKKIFSLLPLLCAALFVACGGNAGGLSDEAVKQINMPGYVVADMVGEDASNMTPQDIVAYDLSCYEQIAQQNAAEGVTVKFDPSTAEFSKNREGYIFFYDMKTAQGVDVTIYYYTDEKGDSKVYGVVKDKLDEALAGAMDDDGPYTEAEVKAHVCDSLLSGDPTPVLFRGTTIDFQGKTRAFIKYYKQ